MLLDLKKWSERESVIRDFKLNLIRESVWYYRIQLKTWSEKEFVIGYFKK